MMNGEPSFDDILRQIGKSTKGGSGKYNNDSAYVGLGKGQIGKCKGNIEAFCSLVRLVYKQIRHLGKDISHAAQIVLDSKSDDEFFDKMKDELSGLGGDVHQKDDLGITKIDENWGKKILREVGKYIDKRELDSSLDIGCGDGSKTIMISKMLGIKLSNIHGTDVPNWGHFEENRNPNLNFKHIKNDESGESTGDLEYEDNSFNLVSMLMVIHHVKASMRQKLLDEVKRVAKPGAYVLIREHDAQNDYDKMLIDIEHSIFSRSYPGRIESDFLSTYYGDYLSKRQLSDMLASNGFKYVQSGFAYEDFGRKTISPTRYYWALYRTPTNNSKQKKYHLH